MSQEPMGQLEIESSNGNYSVRPVMRHAFFVQRPHKEIAALVERAVHRLVDTFAPPLLDSATNDEGDWLPADSAAMKALASDELVGSNSGINSNLALAGSQSNLPDVTVEYTGIAQDLFVDACCALAFSVSFNEYETKREICDELTREFVVDLSCTTAYVSPALVGDQRKYEALAARFRGVDISDVADTARDLEDRIPGVFWRMYVDTERLDALGGLSALDSILTGEVRSQSDEPGGAWITLGDEPKLGDVNRQESMSEYETLARHIHSVGLLHLPRRVTYFDGLEDDPEEAQERYHLRFVT